jgi:molybdate/tungstate transport system ATP-binding protein
MIYKTDNNIVLSIREVEKRFSSFAMTNINLDLYKRDYLILLGPTGSGKTLLLQLICGSVFPDKGEIIIENEVVTRKFPEERGIGIVYQDYLLFPTMTVEKNINFGKKYFLRINKSNKKEFEERFDYIVNGLDIKKLLGRKAKHLSGGEQQRVALARSLVIAPKILLLDEPLSAVDTSMRETIMAELIKIHNELHQTTIHITHNQEEALILGNRIAVISKGNLQQVGNTREVLTKPASSFVAEFLGGRNLYHCKVRNGKKEITINNHKFINSEGISVNGRNNVRICIRPECINLSNKVEKSYAHNIPGKITHCDYKLYAVIFEVSTDIGISMDVIVSYQECNNHDFHIGKQVYLCFNTEDVHVIN